MERIYPLKIRPPTTEFVELLSTHVYVIRKHQIVDNKVEQKLGAKSVDRSLCERKSKMKTLTRKVGRAS